MIFAHVDSCHLCPRRLSLARISAEREGRVAETNALAAIADRALGWRERVMKEREQKERTI